jgi:hypothetical protein
MDRDTYQVALNHLKKHSPDNPIIAAIEDMGYSAVSVAYLESALDTLVIPTAVPEVKKVDSPVLDQLHDKLSGLFVKRAKHSNSYHDVFTDTARAEICRDVLSTQDQIKSVMLTIDYYKKNGELPTVESSEEFDIPTNPFALKNKEEYLRQSICRAKRNIKKLEAEGKESSRANNSLEKLKAHEAIIKRAIETSDLYREGV